MPRPVSAAAVLLALYALAVAAQATVVGLLAGWPVARWPIVVARCAVALLLAHGLRRGWTWAWWVSVPVSGIMAAMAAIAFTALSGSPLSVAGLFAALIVGSLGGACVLLLLPQSRAAF